MYKYTYTYKYIYIYIQVGKKGANSTNTALQKTLPRSQAHGQRHASWKKTLQKRAQIA